MCSVTVWGIRRYSKHSMEPLAQLVLKAQQGDSEAFGLIYDAFAQKLYRYVTTKIGGNKEAAEDILQDTFIKAWNGLPKFQATDSNISAWLYRIATNTVNDYFRKKYRRPDTVELEEFHEIGVADSVPGRLSDAQDMELIRRALLDIPDQYRTILQLRFIEDLTLEETAKVLGKTNVGTRVLQYRALKKLQAVMRVPVEQYTI